MPKIRTGNCFEDSLNKQLAEQSWVLVHGIVLGQGSIAAGLRYPHAWLERNGLCWDPNKNVVHFKHHYYALGHIKWTRKYPIKKTGRMIIKYRTSGPWHPTLLALDDKLENE